MNFGAITSILGHLLIVEAGLMVPSLLVAFFMVVMIGRQYC